MSPSLAAANDPVGPTRGRRTFSTLALPSSDPGAEWIVVDSEHLSREAFALVVASGRACRDSETLEELVSLRNALKRDGKLVVFSPQEALSDLRELVLQAGFARIREFTTDVHGASALELQR